MEISKREKFRRRRFAFFIVIFTLLSMVLIGVAVYLRFVNLDNRSKAALGEKFTSPIEFEVKTDPPEMLNIPPKLVEVGEKYSFPVRVIDPDSKKEDLDVRISEGPAWLHKKENNIIYGYPKRDDIGIHKIVLTITDGKNVERKEFYIEVKKNPSTE